MRGTGLTFWEEFVNLPLAAYTASISGPQFKSGDARGCLFVVYVKTAGTSTLQFRCSAVNSIEAQGFVPTVNVSIPGAGVFLIVTHPTAEPQPPGEAGVTTDTAAVLQVVRMPPPAIWRASMVKGDASSWTFGVRARMLR